MSFVASIPVANIDAANAALQAGGFGPSNFTVPLFTTGVYPAIASLECLANNPAFRTACAALAGVTIRDAGTLVPGFAAAAAALGARYGANAPLLQGSVTPGLYRAIPADGGALWMVIQAFDRAVFGQPLATLTSLVRKAKVPGEVEPWVQPIDGNDAYQAVEPITKQPHRVTHLGKTWDSLIANNVNTPGVANWREVTVNGYPAWLQPTGAGDAYPVGFRVRHLGQDWQNNNPANVFEPGVSGWSVLP